MEKAGGGRNDVNAWVGRKRSFVTMFYDFKEVLTSAFTCRFTVNWIESELSRALNRKGSFSDLMYKFNLLNKR